MAANFDPSKLSSARRSNQGNTPYKPPRAERLQMVVDRYEMTDGVQWAVGHRLNNEESKLRVRLCTGEERHRDMPKASRAEIDRYLGIVPQGVEPPKFSRESLGQKAKDKIKYMQFDDSRFLRKAEDGYVEFRAWWPTAMTANKDAEFITRPSTIVLQTGPEGASRAYVEVVNSATVASGENFDATVAHALANKDANGNARNPSLAVRMCHEGKVLQSARIYPVRETVQVDDPETMRKRDVSLPLDSAVTISEIRAVKSPEEQAEMPEMTRNSYDFFRVAEAGLKGEPMPDLLSLKESVVEDLKNLHSGIADGLVQVELVDIERINFGKDTGAALLERRNKEPLCRYHHDMQSGDKVRTIQKYAKTTVFFQRHESNGAPYATFANPTEQFPQAYELKSLHLSAASTPPKPTAEAANEAATEAAHAPEAPPAEPAGDAFDFGDGDANEPMAIAEADEDGYEPSLP